MKISEISKAEDWELKDELDVLVGKSEKLRGTPLYDDKNVFTRRLSIERKIARIVREFYIRGWIVEIDAGIIMIKKKDGNRKVQGKLV